MNYGIFLSLGQKEVRKGKVREAKIATRLRKKRFQVLNAKSYNTGVDIPAIDPATGQIKQAIESTNHSKKCYIAKERAERYAKSLNQFPYAKKKLVFSYKENVGDEARKILEDGGVEIEVVGYQDLSLDADLFVRAPKQRIIILHNSHDNQTE